MRLALSNRRSNRTANARLRNNRSRGERKATQVNVQLRPGLNVYVGTLSTKQSTSRVVCGEGSELPAKSAAAVIQCSGAHPVGLYQRDRTGDFDLLLDS